MKKHSIPILLGLLLIASFAFGQGTIPIIFDTDMGNDADDAMALAVLHAFIDRGECDLLAVTLTKSSPCAAYVKMFNAYMGIPISQSDYLKRTRTTENTLPRSFT